jgi:hypothetical protein
MLTKQSEPLMPTHCLFPTRVLIATEDRDEHILASHNTKQFPASFTQPTSKAIIKSHANASKLLLIRKLMKNDAVSRAMTQVVSRRSPNAKPGVGPSGICGGQSGTGTHFLRVLRFPLSISFHHGTQCSYFTWGMNNELVGGSSSET